jgi:hypothetical protein
MDGDKGKGPLPFSLSGPIERMPAKEKSASDDDRFLEVVADTLMASSKRGDRQGVITALKALREMDD